MNRPAARGLGDPSWRDDPAWPDVDVVMPIRDEADHLETAVASVRSQTYPGRLRIILGVGPSNDGTAALADRLAADSDDLIVVPNPAGTTPAGLNAAIRAGAAPVIVRVDGHSELPDGYVEHAVEVLRSSGAGNVGGRQVPTPATPFEDAVAAATTSRLGTGGAAYRVGGRAGPTDTVYLGVFDRAAIEDVGLFDERLIRNQDYELNIRLRAAGHTVWFDPQLWVGYRPRGSWRAVISQYFQYGAWKARVLRLHPSSLRLRQLVAGAAAPVTAIASAIAIARAPRTSLVTAVATGLAAALMPRPPRIAVIVATSLAWSAGLLSGGVRGGGPRPTGRGT